MSHKVHPKAFRLRSLTDWDSRWLDRKNFPQYLEEDLRIREFLEKRLKEGALQNIEIERSTGKVNVIVNTARPGLIIGRGGKGAEDLKKELEKVLGKAKPSFAKAMEGKKELKLEIREVRNIWSSAPLVSQWIAQQLEKRMPHRRVLKQAAEKVMTDKEVRGVRIEVSGRLGGSEIARREWLKRGRMPRQTLRAIVDYSQNEALIPQGTVGVKVWIYKGDKFE